MSDILDLPPDHVREVPLLAAADTGGSAAAPADPAAGAAPLATAAVSRESPTMPQAAAPAVDLRALVDLIRLGLAPAVDEATRARASAVWTELAATLAQAPLGASSAASMPAAPSAPAAPMPAAPMPAVPPPSTPIALAARALRNMSPEQLLDLALQRLRAALPPGTTVANPRGIQFALVPVPEPSGKR
jgi:hypothetical protein